MAANKSKSKTKKPAVKLSDEQKRTNRLKAAHQRTSRSMFVNSNFTSIKQLKDKEFTFDHVTSDFDDCFVFENVIVLVEYTTSSDDKVGTHIKGKQGVYSHIEAKPSEFIQHLRSISTELDAALGNKYHPSQLRLKIVYASLNPPKLGHRQLAPNVIFLDYHVAKYFELVTKATRSSGRFEIFDFLGLTYNDVGAAAKKSSHNVERETFHGSILPDTHSNFDSGFKVVSFYASPAALLPRACVLRKYGWREGERAYQRLITPKKIADIRTYLKKHRRVFVNNIIVTLPDSTKLVDDNDDTIIPANITETTPGKIQIPHAYNSIGLIDGQHRVYSYHEGGVFEDEIGSLRDQQNLLVTGIIFPPNMSDSQKLKFEATLFLEINSTQSTAKSELRQEITSILNPYSADAIARSLITRLNDQHGPLQDYFQRYDFETSKVKTSSVVSFALKPFVAKTGPLWSFLDASLVKRFDDQEDTARAEYIEACRAAISTVFSAAKKHMPSALWTADRSVVGHFLTTRNINALIVCAKRLISQFGVRPFADIETYFVDISKFDSSQFGSSQYNAMGDAMFKEFFLDKNFG